MVVELWWSFLHSYSHASPFFFQSYTHFFSFSDWLSDCWRIQLDQDFLCSIWYYINSNCSPNRRKEEDEHNNQMKRVKGEKITFRKKKELEWANWIRNFLIYCAYRTNTNVGCFLFWRTDFNMAFSRIVKKIDKVKLSLTENLFFDKGKSWPGIFASIAVASSYCPLIIIHWAT